MKGELSNGETVGLIVLMIVLSMFVFVAMRSFEPRIGDFEYDTSQMFECRDGYECSSGMALCIESVNSKQLYCESEDVIYPLYNITQRRFDLIIERCPKGIIMNVKECVGDRLEFRRIDTP